MAKCNIKENYTFCPHSEFVCFVWTSEQASGNFRIKHKLVTIINGEFCHKHNLFRTDGIFCNWNYMFRPLLAIFRFLKYWRGVYKCCKNCEGGCWLRNLYINPMAPGQGIDIEIYTQRKKFYFGGVEIGVKIFSLCINFSLFTNSFCTRNRVVRGLM